MANLTVIAVDTGNTNIKTPHAEPFGAGLISHGKTAPPIMVDTLCVGGEYYSLTSKRIPTMYDKTETDDFYILTLFAMAKELQALEPARTYFRRDVCLAVGLPPTHLQQLKDKYISYFGRSGKRVEFTYNNAQLELRVERVMVYPQGYAATVPYRAEIQGYAKSYVVDIGGYTTDVIMFTQRGVPDPSLCESYNMGVIKMYDEVQRAVRSKHRQDLDDYTLDAIVRGKLDPGPDIKRTVYDSIRDYARWMLHGLREKGIDFGLSYIYFVGGGAVLMRDTIDEEVECAHRVIDDVRANAIGYALLAKAALMRESAAGGGC